MSRPNAYYFCALQTTCRPNAYKICFAVQNTCRPDAYQFCAVQTIRRLYAHIAQNKSVSIKMSQHVRPHCGWGPVGPFFEAKVAMLWPPRLGGVFRGRSGCGRRTPGGRRRSVPGRRIRAAARRPRGRTVGCGRRTPGGRGRSAGGRRVVVALIPKVRSLWRKGGKTTIEARQGVGRDRSGPGGGRGIGARGG